MADFVEDMYVYDEVIANTEKKTLYCFECLMEVVNTPFGIEVDMPYYAKQFAEMCGGTFPPASLAALVKRGLLVCDGKCEGKNVYAITQEIYDYYKNVYMPTKEKYKNELNNFSLRNN